MCYEALRNGDATERPLGDVVRAELSDAAVNGVAAAVIVAAVLYGQGYAIGLIAPFAAGALVLGLLIHEAVLVAGVGVQRVRADRREATDPAAR